MLLSAEYRWIPSRVLDMALFVDAGKVAARAPRPRLRRSQDRLWHRVSYSWSDFTPLRLDVAHGDEGIRVHLTGGIAF